MVSLTVSLGRCLIRDWIPLISGLLHLFLMTFRKSAKYASAVLLVVILFLWFLSSDSSEEAGLPAEGTVVEKTIPASSPRITSEAETPEASDASLSEVPEKKVGSLVSNSSGGPIPFEVVSMSELEEVNLTNAGEQHSHKIREWKGRMEPSLASLKQLLESEGEEGVLAISLPDSSQVQVTRMRYESYGANQGVYTGKILGDSFGEVVLSYVNQAVAGSIHDYRNDAVWEIRNAGDGRQYIAQVDVSALGECGVCKEHGVR